MYRYKVKRGDTPLSVANLLGLSPQSLLSANPGVNEFATGMTLKVPQIGASAGSLRSKSGASSNYQGYTMQTGQFGPEKNYGTLSSLQTIRTGPNERAVFRYNGQVVRLAPNSLFNPYQNQGQTGMWQNLQNVLNGGRPAGVQDSASGVTGVRGYNTNVRASPVRPGENQPAFVSGAGVGLQPTIQDVLNNIATGTGQAVKAIGDAFKPGAGGNYPGVRPGGAVPTTFNPNVSESQTGIYKAIDTTNIGTSDLNYQIQDPVQIAQLIQNGQVVTAQQAQIAGYTPEQIQSGISIGAVVSGNASDYPSTPSTNQSQFSVDKYGRRVETYANGTAQRVGNFFGAKGDKWRTYTNDQGQLVTVSTVDYKRRPGYRHYGGGGTITGSGVTGFGLVNFGVGTG